jgi:hypothetical protein
MKKWIQRAGIVAVYVVFTIDEDLRGGRDHDFLRSELRKLWDDCPMKWI